jgi:hypothetical protein
MTHFMLLPGRVLVPCFPGKDIGTAIVIEIGDGAGLAEAEVDGSNKISGLRAERHTIAAANKAVVGSRWILIDSSFSG